MVLSLPRLREVTVSVNHFESRLPVKGSRPGTRAAPAIQFGLDFRTTVLLDEAKKQMWWRRICLDGLFIERCNPAEAKVTIIEINSNLDLTQLLCIRATKKLWEENIP